MLNYLAFDSNKFALYFTPITLFVFFLIIVVILVVFSHKKRKLYENNSEKLKNKADFNKETVKTVYSNKENNFSQTENLPVPENFSTNEFDFEFAGWDKYFVDENGQFVTQAIWTRTPKEYVVKIFGRDEKNPIAVKKVNFGASVDLMELMPEKEFDDNYEYTFIGWDNVPTSVEWDTEIHALFEVKDKNGEVVSTPFETSIEEVSAEDLIQNELLQTQDAAEPENQSELQETETVEEPEVEQETEPENVSNPENFTAKIIEANLSNDFEDNDDNFGYTGEEQIESYESFDENFDEKNSSDEDTKVFNNIKVGKPAITHGVDTTIRSKNGYKIETSNSIYNAFSINVDNKSTSADSDDIFKRAGVGIHGGKQSEEQHSQAKSTVTYNKNPQTNIKPAPVQKVQSDDDGSPEQFFKNTMLVNHRKTIKK